MNVGVNVDVRVHFPPISIHKNSLRFAYLFKTYCVKITLFNNLENYQ